MQLTYTAISAQINAHDLATIFLHLSQISHNK